MTHADTWQPNFWNVRATDPDTSHEAAKDNPGRETMREAVLDIIATRGPLSADEVLLFMAARSPRWADAQRSVIARRITDLAELGLVRDDGRTLNARGSVVTLWAAASSTPERSDAHRPSVPPHSGVLLGTTRQENASAVPAGLPSLTKGRGGGESPHPPAA